MSLVFKINEELATITVTATELLSVSKTIAGLIKAPEFSRRFAEIISEINKSYAVVNDSFAPFCELDSEEKFARQFDEKLAAFKGGYLMDVSKPRRYCDNVYDAYIAMQQTQEAKTTFPMLKRSFSRLDTLYDKWISNDAFLPMSIDGVLKLKNRLLNEIAEMKRKNVEDAYIIFSAAFEDFHDYLTIINNKSTSVSRIMGA